MLFTAAVVSSTGDIYTGGLSSDPAINLVSDSRYPFLIKMTETGKIIWKNTFKDGYPNSRVSMIKIFSKPNFEDTIIAVFETYDVCYYAVHKTSNGNNLA